MDAPPFGPSNLEGPLGPDDVPIEVGHILALLIVTLLDCVFVFCSTDGHLAVGGAAGAGELGCGVDGARQVQRWVVLEEGDRLQVEANSLHRHHREILWAHQMRRACMHRSFSAILSLMVIGKT